MLQKSGASGAGSAERIFTTDIYYSYLLLIITTEEWRVWRRQHSSATTRTRSRSTPASHTRTYTSACCASCFHSIYY